MIEEICEKLGINPSDIALKPRKGSNLERDYSWYELIDLIFIHNSSTKIAQLLNITDKPINNAFRRINFPKSEGGGKTYKYQLLLLIGKKECHKCKLIFDISDYLLDNHAVSGIRSSCKKCIALYRKEWYKEHREEQIQRVIKRSRKLDRVLTKQEIDFIFDRDNYSCQSCGLSNEDHLINWGTRLHIDHIYPISKGGLTTVENSQLLCIRCNSSKNNKIYGDLGQR